MALPQFRECEDYTFDTLSLSRFFVAHTKLVRVRLYACGLGSPLPGIVCQVKSLVLHGCQSKDKGHDMVQSLLSPSSRVEKLELGGKEAFSVAEFHFLLYGYSIMNTRSSTLKHLSLFELDVNGPCSSLLAALPIKKLTLATAESFHFKELYSQYRKGGGPQELELNLSQIPYEDAELEAFCSLIRDKRLTLLKSDSGLRAVCEPVCEAISQNSSIREFFIECEESESLRIIEAFMHHPLISHVEFSTWDNDAVQSEVCVNALRKLLQTNRNVVSVELNFRSVHDLKPLEFRNRAHRVLKVATPSLWPNMLEQIGPSLVFLLLKQELAKILKLSVAKILKLPKKRKRI